MNWDTVIGLEVHTQLLTKSKLFSGSSTKSGAQPNTQTSFIDAAFPGTLPVLNKQALRLAIIFGKAINAQINNLSFFERKNYFYPDLPKGYQISQFQCPIVADGSLEIKSGSATKKIFIERAHLEEDAGKSIHDLNNYSTAIDLNRAGTPLLEIVTTPCLFSADEAINYLKKLHQLLKFLEISDANMQDGSFRCDVNISLKPKGCDKLGIRSELKNLNSFRFIEKAIYIEEERHRHALENNQPLYQETRLYNPDTNTTSSLRTKEDSEDYRYFPEPDLLPIKISQEFLASIKIPDLPDNIKKNLINDTNETDIDFLLSNKEIFKLFNDIKKQTKASNQIIINWLRGAYQNLLSESNLNFPHPHLSAEKLAKLLNALADNQISNNIARKIFTELAKPNSDFEKIIQTELNKNEISTEKLSNTIKDILKNFPSQVQQYHNGKDKLLGFFVGKVMKELKGKGDPGSINLLVKKYLQEYN